LIESGKKPLSLDDAATIMSVDRLERTIDWLYGGAQAAPASARTPLASYQIPDHIASALAEAPPAQASKPAERPRAKNAKGKR